MDAARRICACALPAALAAAAPSAAAADPDRARLALSALLPIVRAIRLAACGGGQGAPDAGSRAAGEAGGSSACAGAQPLAGFTDGLLAAAVDKPALSGATATCGGAGSADPDPDPDPSPEPESGPAGLRALPVLRLMLLAELAAFPPTQAPLRPEQQAAALAAMLAPVTAPEHTESSDPGGTSTSGGTEAAGVAQLALSDMASAGYGCLLGDRALPELLAAVTGAGCSTREPHDRHVPPAVGRSASAEARWSGGPALEALKTLAMRGDPALCSSVIAGLADAAPGLLSAAAASGGSFAEASSVRRPVEGTPAAALACAAVLAALAAGPAAVAGEPDLAPELAAALLTAATDLAQARVCNYCSLDKSSSNRESDPKLQIKFRAALQN